MDCLLLFVFKFKNTRADPFSIIDAVLIQCVHIYITNAMCTNLYLHSACICKTSVPLSVCVCVTSLQRT